MTIALHGVGVSRGIAVGNVHIIQRDQFDIREYSIEPGSINKEIQRFEMAVTNARQQLRAIRDHIPGTTNTDITAFIDTHLLMLEDAALNHEPVRLIRELACNAEWALKLQRDALVNVFEEMDDAYLRTRKDDVDYVVNRIQRMLLNQAPPKHEEPDNLLTGHIVLASDLTPADTVMFQYHGITAFVTQPSLPAAWASLPLWVCSMQCVISMKMISSFLMAPGAWC
jgi:phosphoenolpyruvate-protein phosphotransferase (PTS system enzyme I)